VSWPELMAAMLVPLETGLGSSYRGRRHGTVGSGQLPAWLYGHWATGRTWAMAWAGTLMTPLPVRTLMAPAGPVTSGPHQAWPLVPVTATAAALADVGHQPESAAITARINATMVSRMPARSRAAACPVDGRALAPSVAPLTG
jgi:hypothetical protein